MRSYILPILMALTMSTGTSFAQTPNRPVDLSAFDLRKHPLLKGFRYGSMHPGKRPTGNVKGASAFRDDHFLHDPSEINYLILHFDTPQDLEKWYNAEKKIGIFSVTMSRGWPNSPKPVEQLTGEALAMTRAQTASKKAPYQRYRKEQGLSTDAYLDMLTRRVRTWRSGMLVGRIVILVYGVQHETAALHGLMKARDFVTDDQMETLVEKVTVELARRAKALPASAAPLRNGRGGL